MSKQLVDPARDPFDLKELGCLNSLLILPSIRLTL